MLKNIKHLFWDLYRSWFSYSVLQGGSSIEATSFDFLTLRRKIVHRIIWNNQFADEIEKNTGIGWKIKRKNMGSLSVSHQFSIKIWGHWVTRVLKMGVITALHTRQVQNGSHPKTSPQCLLSFWSLFYQHLDFPAIIFFFLNSFWNVFSSGWYEQICISQSSMHILPIWNTWNDFIQIIKKR